MRPLLTALFIIASMSASNPASAQIPDELVSLAEQGDATAQYQIGKMYERGDRVDADDFTAVRWFQRAAEGGNPDAALDLGWMLSNGYGVTRDLSRAYYWFAVALERGVADAEIQKQALSSDVPMAERHRLNAEAKAAVGIGGASASDGAEARLPPIETIHLDDVASLRRAFWGTWPPDFLDRLKALADRNDPLAQNLLGLALVRATDTSRRQQGQTWLFKAARNGLSAAQYNLASLFLDGRHAQPDPVVAERWLLQAQRSLPRPNSGSYEEVSRLFKEASEYTDRYRAASLGYESASDALQELITLKLQEARALLELNRRRQQ